MKREFNVLLLHSNLEQDEQQAALLAEVAEPRFIAGLQTMIANLQENGARGCIATDRPRFNFDGEIAEDGEEFEHRTVGYEFAIAEEKWNVARSPELEGTAVAHMLALELAQTLNAEAIRALSDLKAILDRFGGQIWIAPYFAENRQIAGYLFHYDHISRLGRGKEPDANLDKPLPLTVNASS